MYKSLSKKVYINEYPRVLNSFMFNQGLLSRTERKSNYACESEIHSISHQQLVFQITVPEPHSLGSERNLGLATESSVVRLAVGFSLLLS